MCSSIQALLQFPECLRQPPVVGPLHAVSSSWGLINPTDSDTGSLISSDFGTNNTFKDSSLPSSLDQRPSPVIGYFSSMALPLFFFYKFIYFIYLFLAALGLCCCARAFSGCGERGLLFVAVRGLLIAVASLVAEHGL